MAYRRSVGIGFWPALFLVFLTLRLCGAIDWSWWWICAPLWGPLVFFLVLLVASALFLLGSFFISKGRWR